MLVLPDYPAMYRDADLVAIVRFVDLKETSKTKELMDLTSKPSELLFRELNGHIKIVSLFKGSVDKPIICRLYRFPTLDECSKDLGDREVARKRLAAHLRDFGFVHVWVGPSMGREIRDVDCLVYFKKSADGLYIPVTGESNSDSAVIPLVPFEFPDPYKHEAEQPADGKTPEAPKPPH